ncbi:MAG: chitinase [Bacteroidota bacterium]|jgi:hypothetical protein|nr:chitinase [Bacteroidota bacterium]
MKILLLKPVTLLLLLFTVFFLQSFIPDTPIIKYACHYEIDSSIVAQKRVLLYLNQKKWDDLFPHRNGNKTSKNKASSVDIYSFANFLDALKFFPEFLVAKNTTLQKRELAAFLANMAFETGGGWPKAPDGYFKWGLYFVEEKGCESGCAQYSDTTKKDWMPVYGQSYHGRGPLQLSWNVNYGQFSAFLFGNKDSLLDHPNIVSQNGMVAFASALWFWMYPQKPKPSCHAVMSGYWQPNHYDSLRNILPGFGAVINIINGGIECGNNQAEEKYSRIGYYKYFCKYFNVTPGSYISCANQKPFNSVL